MTVEQQIKMLLAYAGLTQAELARRLSISPQNLNFKLKKGHFSREEMEQIAATVGAEWRPQFVFPDGKVI